MEIHATRPDTSPPALAALQQQPAYGRALCSIGATVQTLVASDGSALIAQAQVVRRMFGPVRVVWMPRGPVWAPDATSVQKQLVLATLPGVMDKPAIWIGAAESPEDTGIYSAVGYRALVTPQHMAELDLTKPKDMLLRAMHGKWRNRLQHARKSNVRVVHRPLDPTRDQGLLAQEVNQRRDRRYSALPHRFTQVWAVNNPHATRLFMARSDGEILAWMLVLLHAPTATYHLGWTGIEGRRHSAHNLLLWRAANWLVDRDFQRLDLGSVDTEHAPGLARFKIGSGARIRALGPTLLRLPKLQLKRPARHATT